MTRADSALLGKSGTSDVVEVSPAELALVERAKMYGGTCTVTTKQVAAARVLAGLGFGGLLTTGADQAGQPTWSFRLNEDTVIVRRGRS